MREAPTVEQFAQQNSGNAKVVSIGFGADAGASQRWASDLGLNTPLAIVDRQNGVASHYNTFSFPGWVVLDSAGNLVANGSRFDGGVQRALDSAT